MAKELNVTIRGKETVSKAADGAGRMLLGIEARIGELLRSEIPDKGGDAAPSRSGESIKIKKHREMARAIHRNPAAVAAVIAEAEENEDKRRAVLRLLEDAEWGAWSDREIARRCAVGADMVGVVRRSLSKTDSEPAPPRERTYTTKHSTTALPAPALRKGSNAGCLRSFQAGSPPAPAGWWTLAGLTLVSRQLKALPPQALSFPHQTGGHLGV